MPNDCCNTLIIPETVLPEIVNKYIREDEEGEVIFDFELIMLDGYWGTKWPGYEIDVMKNYIHFYTAWSPPVHVIRKLAELHKGTPFRLEYYELGNAFRGVTTAEWKDGKVLFDDNNWNMTDRDFEELELFQEEL
jgi:hypothetical protein